MQAGQYLSEFVTDFDGRMGRQFHKQDRAAASKFIKRACSEGVLFVMDSPVPQREISEILNLFKTVPIKPPYPLITLEYTIKREMDGVYVTLPRVLFAVDQGEVVDIMVAEFFPASKGYPAAWHPPFFGTRLSRDENGSSMMQTGPLMEHAYEKGKAAYERDYAGEKPFDQYCIHNHFKDFITYLEFCKILHEREVTFTDVVPDKKANQMRRARGKAPLFTYKTLTIGGPKQQGHGRGGGTHASPRSHMRRGHFRTMKSGKRVWINSMFVKGNGEGFVHKDYKLLGPQA